jgi:hypothetical protein
MAICSALVRPAWMPASSPASGTPCAARSAPSRVASAKSRSLGSAPSNAARPAASSTATCRRLSSTGNWATTGDADRAAATRSSTIAGSPAIACSTATYASSRIRTVIAIASPRRLSMGHKTPVRDWRPATIRCRPIGGFLCVTAK